MHDDDLLPDRPVDVRGTDPATVRAPEPDLGPQRLLAGLQQSVGNRGVTQLVAAQRAAGTEAEEAPSVNDVIGRGGGSALDDSVRADMESSLGHDFSDVRVHTDSTASASAKGINAHAYTVGNEIVFGAGQYSPGSPSGRETLAHELTHVVQQRSGPVEGTDDGSGVAVSDPGDRFELAASAAASRVAGGEARVLASDGLSSDTTPVTQLHAQREESMEDEEPATG